MKLNPIAANMTEVTVNSQNETTGPFDGEITVLFSYKTPVAVHFAGHGYLKTDHKWSVTTSKHITKWLDGASADTRPQEFFDNLV